MNGTPIDWGDGTYIEWETGTTMLWEINRFIYTFSAIVLRKRTR